LEIVLRRCLLLLGDQERQEMGKKEEQKEQLQQLQPQRHQQ